MKYSLRIFVATIEANNEDEAREQAKELLYELAGSNDGSEVLANAKPLLEEISP